MALNSLSVLRRRIGEFCLAMPSACVMRYLRLRVRLHYQFSGMPGLPNFPEKMAYVIHTKYQYRGKSHNLRSNVVWISRFLIRSLSQNLRVLTPNHMVNYFQPVTAQTYVSSMLKKISATTCSSGAHVLAHMLKSFVDTHTLAAKSINIVRI